MINFSCRGQSIICNNFFDILLEKLNCGVNFAKCVLIADKSARVTLERRATTERSGTEREKGIRETCLVCVPMQENRCRGPQSRS